MCSISTGGPSTINGILYQMLWCLFRVARLHISKVDLDTTSQELTQATLRLEPRGGGGDLQEITASRKVVAQLKARSDEGTWSLREIIEQVLPDLYLATGHGACETDYQFITEGRMGAWSLVYAFFQSLSGRPLPAGNVLDTLDDTKEIPFRRSKPRASPAGVGSPCWSGDPYTERTLFERIVEEVRKRPAIAERKESLETVRRNVWHLLGNFTFVGGQTQDYLRRQVDSLLLALVNFDTEVGEKRDAMLTGLARRAIQGGADLDSTEFLAEYDLDSVPLTNWLVLRERGQKYLAGELRRRGYNADDDVRSDLVTKAITQWSEGSPMLVLSGESGQGKSWLMYALADRLAAEKELAILVEATGDAYRDLDRVAGLFWRQIKGNDTGPGLDRIAARRRELIYGRAERWLTILIDGVQDPAETKSLATLPWEEWNVRLVVTCQPDLAGTIERQARGRAIIFEVRDFSLSQLQLYLETRFGDEWPSIPADIRNTIRRPLLAEIYATVAGDGSWRPSNEYELFSAYWDRLHQAEQALNPLDVVGLQRLARSLLDGARYPWGREQIADAGLDNFAVARLVRLGYLRQTEAGHYEFWHDRILNWAVAQGLVAALHSKQIDAGGFCKHLQSLFVGQQTFSGKFLGYVPMDAVWAVATQESGLSALTDQVIQALEGTGWQYADALYSHLLPTLGPRIVPTLFHRLVAVSCAGDIVLENRIVGAIVTFPESDTAACTAELLKTGSPLTKRAALKILAKYPNPKLLDEIWKLRCETQDKSADFLRPGDWKEMLETECRQAIAAAVPFDLPWLERAIERANPNSEPVHDLAYVLASLDDAAEMWQAHKPALFAKVQPPQHRSLALNIYVHRDVDEVNWLIGQVGRSEDLIGATAFRALIRIDPDLALQHLTALPEQSLYFTRFWCFGELLARRPEATLSRMHQMMKSHPRPRNLGQVFQGQEYALDERTLDFLFVDLEAVVNDELAGRRDPHRAELWGLCELLSKANCLHQLKEFWKRQGTTLEEKLTSWLLKRGWFSGGFVDTEARVALDVLYKIGGTGFTQVVNAYLDSDNRFGCLQGTDLAVKRPDEVTIQKLVRVSHRDDLWEGKHALVQGHATKALATLGRHKEVVDFLLQWGLRTLASVTDHHAGDSETDPAVAKQCLDALASDAPAGALLALGVYGSTQHAELVRRILANAAPNSDTAKACIIALGLLKDESREAAELIRRQMASLDHSFLALRALSRIGTDEA